MRYARPTASAALHFVSFSQILRLGFARIQVNFEKNSQDAEELARHRILAAPPVVRVVSLKIKKSDKSGRMPARQPTVSVYIVTVLAISLRFFAATTQDNARSLFLIFLPFVGNTVLGAAFGIGLGNGTAPMPNV
ncbi:hypothetical protein DFH29DRAFT_1068225 [Suillus ampliporus]|nr:hypothetical protein DFH29DRAFT_1068225 [Suillus ampliporus]